MNILTNSAHMKTQNQYHMHIWGLNELSLGEYHIPTSTAYNTHQFIIFFLSFLSFPFLVNRSKVCSTKDNLGTHLYNSEVDELQ